LPHPSADAGRRPAHPGPGPWEGLGGRSPPRNNRMFIAALCGTAAWTAEVTIVRRVQPPSQPPPAGGRRRVPAPGGGRVREGAVTVPAETRCGRDARAPRSWASRRGAPCARPSDVNIRLRRGGWGNRVAPRPHPVGGPDPPAGEWGNPVAPFPHSVGGLRPPRKDAHPVGVRRSRMDG